ncbi:sigma-70 family RNA polymerase sigma factor [Parapedobacter sp. ISTM3]|uniref:RNA polymerase sigma-70 factor, ECF subfamily n=1 Tax=Parapedobacter luteus TaxID=623280 RepID=A0A1T5A409_9SPHI|nr:MULTISPECIES: sigma-70 family RNA polymerase sigma factor [Parapedobacter]MBK1440116.1 sigma-70 family RNA polymerase sigma factor [Parapedobacter sp. ISTM3]SKB29383.1 RNA polymerase sigma-70 factor, ECF subfamily [Parapedobacter luteus]
MALKRLNNEAAVLKLIANGDEKAFARLFYAYYNQIGAYVQGLTQDTEVTGEIIQEVFAKIWIDRESLPQVKKFDAFLFIICRNHTLNHIRRMVAERGNKEAYRLELDAVHEEEGVTSLADQYELIDRAISLLPPQQKKVFVLRRQGLKNPEISRRMNLSIESVKKYQHLAVKFISEFVKGEALA